jgi:hypothetical protein
MTRIGLSGGHVRGQIVIRSRFLGVCFYGAKAKASARKRAGYFLLSKATKER